MMHLDNFKQQSKKALTHFQDELGHIRASGASPSMLSKVMVESYGSLVPLNQVASVVAPDGLSLLVSPYDTNGIKEVIAGINKANLGLNPVEQAGKIRIAVPALTQEKRELFVKQAKEIAEKAKISIRNIRQDSINKVKADKVLREDESRRAQDDIQKEVEKINKEIDTLLKTKVDQLMKI